MLCRFKATLYHCPESANERMEMATALSSRIDEYEEVRMFTVIFNASVITDTCLHTMLE